MEGLAAENYGTLEPKARQGMDFGSETRTGAVEHNRLMGLLAGAPASPTVPGSRGGQQQEWQAIN